MLLQNSWLPLFVLSLLQCSSTINLTNILTVLLASQCSFVTRNPHDTSSSSLEKFDERESNKSCELRRIQSLLYAFDRLRLTSVEYAYLKLISVLNPQHIIGRLIWVRWISYSPLMHRVLEGVSACDQVEAYRMLAYKELNEYMNDRMVSTSQEKYTEDSERLGRLLLQLPFLAELDTDVVEEIFFVGLIGTFHPWPRIS